MFHRRKHHDWLMIDRALINGKLDRIAAHLDNIEGNQKRIGILMSQELDALTEIKTKLQDVHDDVKARLDVVAGELSAEGKAEVDSIKGALDAFDAEIGDADGSDTEAPPVDSTPSV